MITEQNTKSFEETTAGQVTAIILLSYILACFTDSFHIGFELSQRMENNPMMQFIDVHNLAYANMNIIESVCYTFGRITAFII